MDVPDLTMLLSQATTWLERRPRRRPPRPSSEAVLEAAVAGDAGAAADLADRFSGLLQFGTAGLRGRIGAGPNRMNRAVVIRAASGLSLLHDRAAGRTRARSWSATTPATARTTSPPTPSPWPSRRGTGPAVALRPAHARARLRGARAGRRRRRHGHRLAQPRVGQRLQGVPGRVDHARGRGRADRAAARCRDCRAHRGGPVRRERGARRVGLGGARPRASSTSTRPRWPRSSPRPTARRQPAPRGLRSSSRPSTASAMRRCARR